jgi:hypothetical protein
MFALESEFVECFGGTFGYGVGRFAELVVNFEQSGRRARR